MDKNLIPNKPGQICKIISTVPDLEAEEVYILTDDPSGYKADDEILVVSLTQLQRNMKDPDMAKRIPVRKEELVVVADDLASYVNSWNEK